MEEYKLTPLQREVFMEMARCNPGTTPEMIYKTFHNSERYHYYGDNARPPLVDISPLARLEGLKSVTLYQCAISDLSPLTANPTIEDITLSSTVDILPCDLTALKRLRFLALRAPHCAIPKLEGLPNFSVFCLSETDNLEGLAGLQSLKVLNLNEKNPNLSDLSPLASCPNLQELSLVETAVSDLTPLTGHPNLKKIILSDTKVTDVSPLSTIPTLEQIWLYGTAVTDVSCLASLPNLSDLNLRKSQVTDLSAFQGKESIISIERKKLGIKKAGKSAEEIKNAIQEIQQQMDKLGIIPRAVLKRDDIISFQDKTGVKLPKEYTAFLTKIGDGFEVKFESFTYRFPPLTEVWYDPACISKRFSHRESWCWEDDDNATDRKIAAATQNGQIELVNCGCGQSFRLILCGGAKGEVWEMADVGCAPYGNGLDFLDWMRDFLNGKVVR